MIVVGLIQSEEEMLELKAVVDIVIIANRFKDLPSRRG